MRISLQPWQRKLLAWLPAVVLYSCITWLSSKPSLPGPDSLFWQWVWFKTAHMLVYASLAVLVWFGWFAQGLRGHRAILATWFVLMIAASVDEWHQMFVPGRTPRPLDVFIDLSAAFVALRCLVPLLLSRTFVRRLTSWFQQFT